MECDFCASLFGVLSEELDLFVAIEDEETWMLVRYLGFTKSRMINGEATLTGARESRISPPGSVVRTSNPRPPGANSDLSPSVRDLRGNLRRGY